MTKFYRVTYDCGCYFSSNLIDADRVEDATKYAEAHASKFGYTVLKLTEISEAERVSEILKGMPVSSLLTVREFCEGLTDIDGTPVQAEEETEASEPANQEKTVADLIRAELKHSTRSAWSRGVAEYIAELLESVEVAENDGRVKPGSVPAIWDLHYIMLNGAANWKQYSEGGSSLVYDEDIARRLCSPSELKRTKNGTRNPNSSETWLDVQARALYQAEMAIKDAARVAAWRREVR